MKRQISYGIALFIPIILSLIALILRYISKEYFYRNDFLDDIMFFMRFIVLNFGVPIYLAIVNNTYIYKFNLDIWKSLKSSFLIILLNSAICWPNSIYAYFVWLICGSYTEALNDYIDFFPIFIIVQTILLLFMMINIMLVFRAYVSIKETIERRKAK